jgi:hypothetical protein
MSSFFSNVVMAVAATGIISGCTVHQPPRPTGAWSNVNKSAPLYEVATPHKPTAQAPISISLENAIAQFAPPIYRLEIDPDVDMATIITYDSSKNWLEALAQGMSEASIEFTANLHRKSGTIKRSTITLAEVIDLLLPNEYTVFSDATLNQGTLLYFDQRKHWIDALNNGVTAASIELKIDFTQKVIYLRPTNKLSGFSTSISHTQKSDQ